MTSEITIRLLTGDDAAAYQAIRLRSLREHPEAFASAYEDEKDTPLDKIAERLNEPPAERFMLGAVADGALVGVVGGFRESPRKCRHRGHIGAMYVAPEARGKGAGRALITAAIRRLWALDGIEEIKLAVTVGNTAAAALYKSLGFETLYIEPRFFKIDGIYYDTTWMLLRANG